jgi:hypothetical protein
MDEPEGHYGKMIKVTHTNTNTVWSHLYEKPKRGKFIEGERTMVAVRLIDGESEKLLVKGYKFLAIRWIKIGYLVF